jgi:replicative DNA helicase
VTEVVATKSAVLQRGLGTEPVYALDLDWDLIQHLALPESIGVLQAEQFTPDLLEDPLAQEVFEWQMNHQREHGKPASAAVLEDQFGQVTIAEPQTAVGDLVTRIRERYMRNTGREVVRNLALLVNEDPLTVAKEMMRGGRQLADLTLKRGEVFGTGDFHRLMGLYDKKAAQGRGPSLGFKEVDDHFNGMLGVTFLIAAPKTYKSWFTINGTMANVLEGGFPYLYSLELPADEATQRLVCMTADVPYWKYLKRALFPEDRERMKEAYRFLDDGGNFRIEKPNQGERSAERLINRALNAGASAVFIDQLQYMETNKGVSLGAANNTGDYFDVVNDLRNYSDEIPIFVVHQFNRSVMNAKEMPEMQQGKGSSAIEEVATLSLGLWANKEMRKNNVIELGTLASRNYGYESWRLGVQLSHGCEISMLGPVDDDDDE